MELASEVVGVGGSIVAGVASDLNAHRLPKLLVGSNRHRPVATETWSIRNTKPTGMHVMAVEAPLIAVYLGDELLLIDIGKPAVSPRIATKTRRICCCAQHTRYLPNLKGRLYTHSIYLVA
jgi:hypothetical protein